MARETAGSVAGAGATLLIEAGHAAGSLVRSLWTAPPIKIPGHIIDKKAKGDIEIPPAIFLAAVGALGLYVWARKNGITPFDWLWAEIEKARASAGASSADASGGTYEKTAGADVPIATTKRRIAKIDELLKKIAIYQQYPPKGWDTQEGKNAIMALEQERAGLIDYLATRGESYP